MNNLIKKLLVELNRIRTAILLCFFSIIIYGFKESIYTLAFLSLFISYFLIVCFLVHKELFIKYNWDVGSRLNELWQKKTLSTHRLVLAISMLLVRVIIYISILFALTFLTAILLKGHAFGVDIKHYCSLVDEEANKIWTDVNRYHILGQIKVESNFKETAIRIEPSGVISYGLMQVLDVTLADMKKKHKLLIDVEPVKMLQAKYSIRAGLIYDYDMWKLCWFAVDELNRYAFMFSAYNGGYGWLLKDRKLTADNGYNPNVWFSNVEKFSNRSKTAFKINREYPIKILKYSNLYEVNELCRKQ